MAGEAEKELYDATVKGDLTAFEDVLQRHRHLLDGASFTYSRNVLHIATLRGKVVIVREVLKRNPLLAEDLDSKNSSPLHIAAGKGHLQIVSMLSAIAPDMCFSLDWQGMNPIHVAAKNGRVEILKHLLELNPSPAMERMNRGETVLHLCVKHGQLGSFHVLVMKLGDFVHAKNDDGNTLLHLAVRCNQLEMVRYLIQSTNLHVKTINSMGYTPRLILRKMPSNHTTSEMEKVLKTSRFLLRYEVDPNSRDGIMVVLALIAAVAFQSVVAPPGGLRQEDSSSHRVGEAVMASNRPNMYKFFIFFNTCAFVVSLLLMLILIPLRITIVYILLPIVFCGLSYGASLMVIQPSRVNQKFEPVLFGFICISFSFAILIGLVNFFKRRIERH